MGADNVSLLWHEYTTNRDDQPPYSIGSFAFMVWFADEVVRLRAVESKTAKLEAALRSIVAIWTESKRDYESDSNDIALLARRVLEDK